MSYTWKGQQTLIYRGNEYRRGDTVTKAVAEMYGPKLVDGDKVAKLHKDFQKPVAAEPEDDSDSGDGTEDGA